MHNRQNKIPLLVITGPTASGKTALSIWLAKELGGEIVSADSMQIYKGMDIGTAKPDEHERAGVPHHMLDILEPDETFSVAQYVEMAGSVIADIAARGKLPIVVGGTGLYIQALVDNIQFAEIKTDPAVRERLQQEAAEHGNQHLWNRLSQVDATLAQALHPNNLGRIIRALEVFEATGVPMSEHQRLSRSKPSPYLPCIIGLSFRNRELLYQRIDKRVEQMAELGLEQEVRSLMASCSPTALQAIGYKEFAGYLAGESTLEQALEEIKLQSRRYAKRQLTWLRRDERVNWLFWDEYENSCQLWQAAKAMAETLLP